MKTWCLLAMSLALPLAGIAGTITVYNTGLDSSGNVITVNGDIDAHYTDSIVGNTVYYVDPNPAWANLGGVAGYIAPSTDQGASYDGGVYTLDYNLSVDLTGFDPSSVAISGEWSTDNFGNDILVNGNSTGQTNGDYADLTSFSLSGSSGFFTSGVNTLTFVWGNSGGPGGLGVIFTSATANPAAPEPGSLLLLGAGLATLAAIGRRRFRRN